MTPYDWETDSDDEVLGSGAIVCAFYVFVALAFLMLVVALWP